MRLHAFSAHRAPDRPTPTRRINGHNPMHPVLVSLEAYEHNGWVVVGGGGGRAKGELSGRVDVKAQDKIGKTG